MGELREKKRDWLGFEKSGSQARAAELRAEAKRAKSAKKAGQPGYARDGKVVVFFRSGQMNKERYSTFGVSAKANLDEESGCWPTSYALTDPTEEAWERIREIVERA